MVGVSRACQACRDAQLQCNTPPPCARCQALNIICTPLPRVFKFRDEAPALRQRYQSASSTASSQSSSPSTPPDQSLQKVDRSSRSSPPVPSRAKYKPVMLSMDDHLNPSLTVKAVGSQQTQVFTNFILAAFPCFFRSTETRVPVNWVVYVDKRGGSMNSCFDWAVRASTAAYIGSLHNDSRYAQASQALYHKSLRGLAKLLANEGSAKSDEALATAITLAVFEKHNCSGPNAWLRHAAGIRTLMKLRGPQAHLDGFGRAMYIVYRNFLITAALVEGEACFLEEPEWRELNEQIAAENAKLPSSSLYTDVVERGFLEVIKVPGYVKRTREMKNQRPKDRAQLQTALLQDVQAARAALRGIYTEFGVSLSMLRSGQDGNDTFVGPVPDFFEGYSSLFSRGLRQALLILNYLISILDSKQRTTIESENFALLNDMGRNTGSSRPASKYKPPLTPPTSPTRPSIVVESLITEEMKQPPTTDWMDRIISTMGLEAVNITLVG